MNYYPQLSQYKTREEFEEALKTYYIQCLRNHDWSYNYSDDHRVWVTGNRERMNLFQMRLQIDDTNELWNKYCPDGYQIV